MNKSNTILNGLTIRFTLFLSKLIKMKNLFFLSIFLFLLTACSNPELDQKVKDLQMELDNTKTALEEAKALAPTALGMIHSVFFWLKEDLSEADEAAFVDGLKSLKKVSTIKNCHIGPPAPTEARGVVDNSYSYALIVHFENVEGQNAYQIDPIHLKFVEDHQDKWTKVIVYDNMVSD